MVTIHRTAINRTDSDIVTIIIAQACIVKVYCLQLLS